MNNDDFIVSKMHEQATEFEKNGDLDSANAIRELINSLKGNRKDDAEVTINERTTIEVFEGDNTDGDPIEIRTYGE